MEQNESEQSKEPPQNGDQRNQPRRSSIELQKVETTVPLETAKAKAYRDSVKFSRPEVIYKAQSEPGTWMFCLKCSLIFLNTIIWVLGLAIAGFCTWMAVDPEFLNLSLNLNIPTFGKAVYVGIAIGVIILLVGLVGCIGAWKGSMCLLITIFIIMLLVIVLEAVAMGLVWHTTNSSEVQENLKQYIIKGVNLRCEHESIRYFIDLLQTKLKCCAAEDENDGYDSYDRCTAELKCIDEDTGSPYDTNCLDAAIEFLKGKSAIIGGIAASTLTFQVAVMVLSMCLYCGLRQAKQNIF